VSIYLDASVLVAMFTTDIHTGRAEAFLRGHPLDFLVSDFAGAEFASAVGRHVRTRDVTEQHARMAFAAFDDWVARWATKVSGQEADVLMATAILRRLDLNIRTADALNIAIAVRLDATLATFDDRMAENARALGASVAAA
jgi:predicted nucleic acid-binding protein